MASIKPQQNQTILDLAIQEYGSIEGLFDVLENNQLDQVDYDFSVYEEIAIDGFPVRREIVEYYTSRGVIPASGLNNEDLLILKRMLFNGEGIGAWTIGEDFEVSGDGTESSVLISGLVFFGDQLGAQVDPLLLSALRYGVVTDDGSIENVQPIITGEITQSLQPFTIEINTSNNYKVFLDTTIVSDLDFTDPLRIILSESINVFEKDIFNGNSVYQLTDTGNNFIIRIYQEDTFSGTK